MMLHLEREGLIQNNRLIINDCGVIFMSIDETVETYELDIPASKDTNYLAEVSVADVEDARHIISAVIEQLKQRGVYRHDLLYRMVSAERLPLLLDRGTDRDFSTCKWNALNDGRSPEEIIFLAKEDESYQFAYLIGDYRADGKVGIAVFSHQGFDFVPDAPIGYAAFKPEFRDIKRELVVAAFRVNLNQI